MEPLLEDTARPGDLYYTFGTEDVVALVTTVVSPVSKTAYVEYRLDPSSSTLTLTVLPSFPRYELDETTATIKTTLALTCAKGESQIDVVITVNDNNNHRPEWNPSVSVPLTLPMPFPNGLAVADYSAKDADLSNPGVVFSLDADGAKWFQFSPPQVTGGHDYRTTLKSIRQLTFEETFTFQVTVTDTASPTLSSVETITIEPDGELSTPTSPRFTGPIYSADVDGEMKPNDEIVFASPIDFSEGFDESISLSLGVNSAPGMFEAKLVGKQVKIILLSKLTDEMLDLPYIVLTLEATRPKAANTGRTVVLLSPPPPKECEVTTTPEPTTTVTTPGGSTSPGECPVCPTDPTNPATTTTTTTTTTQAPTSEVPGSSISFQEPDYSVTIDAKFTGVVVKVTAVSDPVMTVVYAIQTESENVRDRTRVDSEGRISARELPPGVHRLVATAGVLGTSLAATTNVSIQVRSIEGGGEDTPGFPYALTVVSVPENTEGVVIPAGETHVAGKGCVYTLAGDQANLFRLDSTTGALSSNKIDREDAIFVGQTTAQLTVRLHVQCDEHGMTNTTHPVTFVGPRSSQHDCILVDQVENSRQDMTVIAVIEDENDHTPMFVGRNPRVVGYPSDSLLDQIQPPALTTVLATDGDSGPRAQIAYSIDGGHERFHVERSTGVVYVMGGSRALADQNVSVLATDMDGRGWTGVPLDLRVKVLEMDQVSLILIEGALLSNVADILREMSTKSGLEVGLLSASVMPRKMADSQDVRDDEGRLSALLLTVYAVDYLGEWIVTTAELAKKLDKLEFEWPIDNVQSYPPDSSEWANADDAGLVAATISLGIVCGILLIGSGVLAFFSYVKPRMDRNSHMKGLIAHGYENSEADATSDGFGSQHEESVKQVDAWMVQDDKTRGSETQADAHLTILDGQRSHSSCDSSPRDDASRALERKKSIVTFNESVDCIEIERL